MEGVLELGGIRRIAINGEGVEGFFTFGKLEDDFCGRLGLDGDCAVEAAAVADVAGGFLAADGWAIKGDLDDDAVLIVIDEHAFYVLQHAGAFAFFPEGLPRAGPVVGEAGADGEAEGLGIHEGEHEHFAGL